MLGSTFLGVKAERKLELRVLSHLLSWLVPVSTLNRRYQTILWKGNEAFSVFGHF